MAGSGGNGGATGGSGGAGGAGGAGGSTSPCGGLASVDDDGDGFTEMQGDCDDCDGAVGPASAEIMAAPGADPVDEDCDGLADDQDPDLQPCDAALGLDSEDPLDAVKAIGFCDHAKFLEKATWVLADGQPPGPNVDMAKFHLGHGLLDHFGTNDGPREGQRMMALSSGTARNVEEPGFVSRNFNKGYSSPPPATFQGETPACPGVVVANSSVQDAAGLELSITAPPNATGLSFRFNFRTYEFPQYVCTAFSDVFWTNFVQGAVQKNVTYDDLGNTIGSHSTFLTQCDCPPAGPGACALPGGLSFDCDGTALLDGTDFDGNTNPGTWAGWTNGGTEWLVTRVPVQSGKVFAIRFVVFDSGVVSGMKDHAVDSTVLVDDFRWHDDPLSNETGAD